MKTFVTGFLLADIVLIAAYMGVFEFIFKSKSVGVDSEGIGGPTRNWCSFHEEDVELLSVHAYKGTIRHFQYKLASYSPKDYVPVHSMKVVF